MAKTIIAAILLLLILAACAPNPRDQAELVKAQAEAAAAETQARQSALDAEQARAHQAALDRIAEGEAVHRQAAVTQAVALFVFSLSAALAVIVIGGALALAVYAVGRSVTRSARDAVQALTIRVDPETGQPPLLIAPSQAARWSLIDTRAGSVRLLGDKRDASPLEVRANHHTLTTAVVARAARLAKGENGAYVSGVRQPMMLEDKDDE